MKIDLKRIIQNSGEKISQRKIAAEMVKRGMFKNVHSAIGMIYHFNKNPKTVPIEYVEFLMERFGLTLEEVFGK